MSQPPASTEPSHADRAAAWTQYWASGALHSCGSSFHGNYSGAIAAFWAHAFAELPAAANVLDVCCGNAPLSKLLLDSAQRSHVATLTAVDVAAVAPPWLAALSADDRQRVTVLGGTDIAHLPLPNGSVDFAMSQYGIEYAGSTAIDELARVLRPAGRFAAVLHHCTALPVRLAEIERQDLHWLLDELQLPDQVQAVLEPMARSSSVAGQAALRGDAVANAARAGFNQAMQAVDQRRQQTAVPDRLEEALRSAQQCAWLARAHGLQAAQVHWETWRVQLRQAQLQLDELVACAMNEAQLRERLAPLGELESLATVNLPDGQLAGWAVRVLRPATAASFR